MPHFLHLLFQTACGWSALAYLGALVLSAVALARHRPRLDHLARAAFAVGVLVNLGAIAQRWVEFGQPPFRSLYESMVLLGACLGLLGLVLTRLYRSRPLAIGMLASSLGALTFALTRFDPTPTLLPPALRSVWFIPHVVLYFFGYAFLAFAALTAALHLWTTRAGQSERGGGGPAGAHDFFAMADRALGVGFVLITVALLIGSIWAQSAWGDYWAWDPKENWALATWLVYAAYLHLRRLPAWRARRAAWLPIAGFALLLFTYLGMGLLPTADESAHVYLEASAPPPAGG